MTTALVIKPVFEDFFLDKNTKKIVEVFDRVEILQSRRLGNYMQHKCRTEDGIVFYAGDATVQL